MAHSNSSTWSSNSIVLRLSLALLVGSTLSCSAAKPPYVWYVEIPRDPADAQRLKRIESADKIRIVVQGQEEMSGEYVVSTDGTYVQPLAGVIVVGGLGLDAAAQSIAERLRPFVKEPVVSVTILETHPITVNAIGEVAQTGAYKLNHGDNLVDLIALAGGLSEFADRDSIYVLRDGKPAKRIRFKYAQLVEPKSDAWGFVLKDGDTVLVE